MESFVGTLAELFSEILMIAVALMAFIFFVGIKRSCPHCGERFYYRKGQSICSQCQGDLDVEINEKGYICPICGAQFYLQIDACPQCNAPLDDAFYGVSGIPEMASQDNLSEVEISGNLESLETPTEKLDV